MYRAHKSNFDSGVYYFNFLNYTGFQKYQKASKISQKSSKAERRQTEQTSVSGSGSESHKIFDDDVNGTQNDVNSFRYHSYIMYALFWGEAGQKN